jgi:hypothetical protein
MFMKGIPFLILGVIKYILKLLILGGNELILYSFLRVFTLYGIDIIDMGNSLN